MKQRDPDPLYERLVYALTEAKSILGSPTTETFSDHLLGGMPRRETLLRWRKLIIEAGNGQLPENLEGPWHTPDKNLASFGKERK